MALEVRFFGGLQIERGGARLGGFRSSKIESLLAYLIFYHNQTHSREVLTGLFWAESKEAKAKASLRQALYLLRKHLGPEAIVAHGRNVQISSKLEYWCDAHQFESLLTQSRSAPSPAKETLLKRAVALYHGDFLAGFYDDWCLFEAERLKDLYLRALIELIRLFRSHGDHLEAIEYALRALKANPLQEDVHRELMLLYYVTGDQGRALQQYREVERILKEELDVEPQPETKQLFEQIVRGAALALTRVIPNDLPHPLTSFIGRAKEIEGVKNSLNTTRLLTLTGIGGCGKSRLALQVAHQLLGRYPDGVWWVDLAALSEESLVPQAVASALKVREQAGCSLVQSLADHLQNKNTLLIFDNCEHLVDACAQLVEALLQDCPNVRVLATSRETLGIAGELVWLVPPLATPDQPYSPERLMQYDAVRLLLERASVRQVDSLLAEQNGPLLVQLCQRLEGIPLAIELAAARCKMLSLEQITQRLDDRFRVLTGGRRTALPRHRTLHATMEWSYNLLAEKEQMLLCRLSVFAGGWTLEAAESVCGGEGIDLREVLDLLTHLVDKSLVIAEPERHRMLETVRQYAQEKLMARQESDIVRKRHLQYFLGLSEQAEPELMGPNQKTWLERLEREHDNLRSALEWAKKSGPVEWGLRLSTCLAPFWERHGHVTEGRRWLQHMLECPGSVAAVARSKGYNAAGNLARIQGDYSAAYRCYRESLALLQELGDRRRSASALNNLGAVAKEKGDYTAARSFYEESLVIKQELGDTRGMAIVLNNLGVLANAQGDFKEAGTFLNQSLALFQQEKDQWGIALALNNLGITTSGQGDYAQAIAWHKRSLVLRRDLQDRWGIAECLEGVARALHSQGYAKRSVCLLGAAAALRENLGFPLPPDEHPAYERMLDALCSQLGSQALNNAWVEGRAMSLEDAVVYALEETAENLS